MDKNYMFKKAREFDSDGNKIEELATFLRMYTSVFAGGNQSEMSLKNNIEGLSDYFINIDFKWGKNELQTIKDFVLIEKFFWFIDLINRTVPGINIGQLDNYVKVLKCLENNQLLDSFIRYTNYEKLRVSSELDLLKYEYASVKKITNTEVKEVTNIADVLILTITKLSCAYWNIIENPEKIEDIKRTTFEYADLLKDLINENYKGRNLKEFLIGDDSILLYKKYAEIYGVIFSPESILVIMNNYRMAQECDRDSARTLLLKTADLQSIFIFDKQILFQEDELIADDYCKSIYLRLDDYINYINDLEHKETVIPAVPFYNVNYFASRVGKDDIDEAKIIVEIDWINDAVLYDNAKVDFDLFVDEVLTSCAENLINEGKPINSEYDTDVYAAIIQILGGNYPDDVVRFMNQYEKKVNLKYANISRTVKYYLLGIYLRTLYILADSIEGHDGEYPFRVYRDKIQSLLFDDKSYGKASSIFSRYSLKDMNMVEEKAYSNIKTEILMSLDAAMENVESYDDLIKMDLKIVYSKYFLYLGRDDYFLNMIEGVCQRIRKNLELYVGPEPQYRKLLDDLIQQYEEQMKKVEAKVNSYTNNDSLLVHDKVKKTISSIATGEFLYQQYIVRDDIPQMDFSCIALEYYTALELLVNVIFYDPYRQKVLKPLCESNSGEDLDEKLRGYIGTSKASYIIGRDNEPKDSLELGTISNLYINLFKRNGRDIQPKSVKVAAYLDDFGLEKTSVCCIFKEINRVTDLRNETAHGGEILPCEKAKKAQDVVFIHTPNPDPTIDIDKKCLAAACHNLIGEIFDLF